MEVRQLPSTQALEAKLSRMSYPAAKDHENMLRTAGKLTVTDVAKISFFFCFVVRGRRASPAGNLLGLACPGLAFGSQDEQGFNIPQFNPKAQTLACAFVFVSARSFLVSYISFLTFLLL